MHAGVRLYTLASTKYHESFIPPDEPMSRYPVTVAFACRGNAIVSGTNCGRVCVWEIGSRKAPQTLEHEGALNDFGQKLHCTQSCLR
jgi:hypothetical protein